MGPEEEAFRQELGAFLDRELPPENRIDSDTVGTTDEQYHFFHWAHRFRGVLMDFGVLGPED